MRNVCFYFLFPGIGKVIHSDTGVSERKGTYNLVWFSV